MRGGNLVWILLGIKVDDWDDWMLIMVYIDLMQQCFVIVSRFSTFSLQSTVQPSIELAWMYVLHTSLCKLQEQRE